MRHVKLFAISMSAGAIIFIIAMNWYQGSAPPLTVSEVDSYMARIEAQSQRPGGRHDLPALRSFLASDDGKPIYTVNLYKFNEIADYSDESKFNGSGLEAYDRFSAVMIGLMAKRGSHPVFGSRWTHSISSQWDRIVIVRYRSRRDLVDLFATDDFADASIHKWASLREHDRMLVQATHIPDGKFVIMLIAILISMGSYFLGRMLLTRTQV
ncbi:MAG: hypothetical protein ACSHX3_02380 [Litorimonas sp.]